MKIQFLWDCSTKKVTGMTHNQNQTQRPIKKKSPINPECFIYYPYCAESSCFSHIYLVLMWKSSSRVSLGKLSKMLPPDLQSCSHMSALHLYWDVNIRYLVVRMAWQPSMFFLKSCLAGFSLHFHSNYKNNRLCESVDPSRNTCLLRGRLLSERAN